ncbi:GNAT family N-acetyltransferase [Paenibacillus spiritus]|uniref:GNAT family N-acetyltransferase n=1 Tax=Paenibacillus spiritus TaxID=2496557 RepID=A0A5J5GDM4_9BACL|nr:MULTISPECIES: GNAT family N-acetyltransferase [Paenibacillus]KAA9006296.1 GNAT family N-acetyltransferase [Paenibacillus spiritus]
MNSSIQTATLQIRKCRSCDLEAVTSLVKSCGYPTTLGVMKERMEASEKDDHHGTLVALLDGRTAGMVSLTRVGSYYMQRDMAEITAIVVSEEHRGEGLGRRLMAAAEEWARARGCAQIFLRSGNRVEKAPAHAFYRHLGFEQNGYRFSKSV